MSTSNGLTHKIDSAVFHIARLYGIKDLKLEEIATMEQLDGDFEIVSLGLRDTHTYFASGYLCHQ